MAKMGRPTKFSQKLADDLCDHLAEGKSLRSWCEDFDDHPKHTTILRWLRENEDFRSQYEQAREDQADKFAEEVSEIADEALELIEGDKSDNARMTAVKLRMDARIWATSKMRPKKYGASVDLKNNGGKFDGMPIVGMIFKKDESA